MYTVQGQKEWWRVVSPPPNGYKSAPYGTKKEALAAARQLNLEQREFLRRKDRNMKQGTILSIKAAQAVNQVLEEEGYAAVLKHLAFFAQREMPDFGNAGDVSRVLVTLANRLVQGQAPGKLT